MSKEVIDPTVPSPELEEFELRLEELALVAGGSKYYAAGGRSEADEGG